jgi:hypothetical protein
VLAQNPDRKLRALVVWEPVIATDVAPPTTSVMGRLTDVRVRQFWDPEQVVSGAVLRRWKSRNVDVGDVSVVWDFVALFDPGPRWDGGPPDSRFHGYPVVDAIDGLRAALRR